MTRQSARRRGWVRCLMLAVLAAVSVLGVGAAGRPPAAPATATVFLFLPTVMKPPPPVLINIIANPSFEDEHWYTDYAGGGNQWPSGWTFYSPANGAVMPFPTKSQQGNTIPAISGGQGEYVHKYQHQLPTDEYLGAPRGLIIDGQLTYKAFSDHVPNALMLSQTLHYTPGRAVEVTGYILGETNVFSCSGNGLLEDDHFIGSVQLGSNADTRLYVNMKDRRDVPGNERAWNKFAVASVVPANGELLLKMIVQSNWGCQVNFFIDDFAAYYLP